MASIFVQIPSYHDEELLPTLSNMILTSSGEHQINFGIHNGFYKKPIFNESDLKSVNNKCKISVYSSCFPENIGVGVSRAIANSFYDGEDFYLQTDSHMRFCKDWDSNIIFNYQMFCDRYGFDKLIFSCYPSRYNYFKENDHQILVSDNTYRDNLGVPWRIPLEEDSEVNLFLNNHLKLGVSLKSVKYTFSNIYMSGAFGFSIGDYSKIKPNTQIIGAFEEMLHSFRAYTHGFDVVPPPYNIAAHLWRSKTVNQDSSKEEHDTAIFYNKRRFLDYDCWINDFALHEKYKNLEEIKNIIINNRIDDQGFGTERDFQELMKKLT